MLASINRRFFLYLFNCVCLWFVCFLTSAKTMYCNWQSQPYWRMLFLRGKKNNYTVQQIIKNQSRHQKNKTETYNLALCRFFSYGIFLSVLQSSLYRIKKLCLLEGGGKNKCGVNKKHCAGKGLKNACGFLRELFTWSCCPSHGQHGVDEGYPVTGMCFLL